MLLTREEIYFQKICLLLTLSLQAVRKVFDEQIPPLQLRKTLDRNYVTLKKLRNRRIITSFQWKILFFNQEGSISSSLFDITLMVNLLQQLAPGLQVPKEADKLPLETDDSVGAHLGTIKYYRNLLVHSSTNKLKSEAYSNAWSRLSQAIRKLMKPSGTLEEELCRIKEMDIEQVNNDMKFEINNSLIEIKRFRASYGDLLEKLHQVEEIVSNNVPSNIRNHNTTQLNDWQKEDQLFVRTSCSEQIQVLVQQNKLTAIIGGHGSGKTAVMHHIALKLREDGYFVIPVTLPNDIIKFYQATRKTLYVIDDFCGKHTLDPYSYNSWAQSFKLIADIPLMDNFKILLACRLQVFLDARFNFKSMFEDCCHNLHESNSTFTWAEKIAIAQNYGLKFNGNDFNMRQNLQSCYCFPLLCSVYEHHEEHVAGDIFIYPYSVLENELEMMFLDHDDGKFCAIALLVMFNNHLPQKYLINGMDIEAKRIVEITLIACNLTKDHKIIDDIESLMQSFVLKTDNVYHALDSQMFDFLAHFVGEKMTDHLIQNAAATLVNERCMFVLPLADKKSFRNLVGNTYTIFVDPVMHLQILGKNVIIIPLELEQIYFDRMIDDWCKGYVNAVIGNVNFFYNRFFTYLNNSSHLKDLVKIIDIKDKNTSLLAFVQMYGGALPQIDWFVSKGADINHRDIYNRTSLFYACTGNKLDVVERLLYKHADPNIRDKDGVSPLHMASTHGSVKIVEKLLNTNANINAQNNIGESPLFVACSFKRIEIVKKLLKRNADIHLNDYQQRMSPLQVAECSGNKTLIAVFLNKFLLESCTNGSLKKVNKLIDNGADVNYCDDLKQSPLFLATKHGHIPVVKTLLRQNAYVDSSNNHGISPLFIASCSGQFETGHNLNKKEVIRKESDIIDQRSMKLINQDILFELLTNNASVNQMDNEGNTPLMYACIHSNMYALKKLLLFDSNINDCNKNGLSPLFMACDAGNLNIFKLLIKSGASIPICLLIAVQKGRLDIIRRLPKNEAIVNCTDKTLDTPLLIACRQGRLDIATELMQYNANLNQRNLEGETPLLAACAFPNRCNNLVYQLLRKEAKVNRANYEGQTPLHLSVIHLSRQLVFLLRVYNAKVNKTDNNGKTPLSLAKHLGDVDIISLLESEQEF